MIIFHLLSPCTAASSFAAGPTPPLALADLDGRRVDLAALRGQVVLVNFWATSCTTCVAEMPQLMALHQRFQPRAFETLAVAMSYDPPARVSFAPDT